MTVDGLRRCELVVAGELSPRFQLAFEGMAVRTGDGRTAISGVVSDRAQLHGLIDRVLELGLDLLVVSVTPETHAEVEGGCQAPRMRLADRQVAGR